MVLFTNLKEVKIGSVEYKPIPILKLTTDLRFSKEILKKSQMMNLQLLNEEAAKNGFQVLINKTNLVKILL